MRVDMYRTESGEDLPLSVLVCSEEDEDEGRNGMFEAAKGVFRLAMVHLQRADRMEIIAVDVLVISFFVSASIVD